jgi:hypothetical protein
VLARLICKLWCGTRRQTEQGDATAQSNLAVGGGRKLHRSGGPKLHTGGRGVPKDYKQAASLYRAAADQGFAEAERDLGLMYETDTASRRTTIKPRRGTARRPSRATPRRSMPSPSYRIRRSGDTARGPLCRTSDPEHRRGE